MSDEGVPLPTEDPGATHAGQARGVGWKESEPFDYEMFKGEVKPTEGGEQAPELPEWASNAAKYEWKEEYGDVGPENPELEKMLFHDENHVRSGEKLDVLQCPKVNLESPNKIQPIAYFEDAGLHPVMLNNIKLCGYEMPTPIQAYVLPAIFQDCDVIGIAQTGSGKTAAFLIPVLSKLMGKAKKLCAPRPFVTSSTWTRYQGVRAEPLVLIVVPTRELATQIFDEARRLCYRSMLRPCVIYGGGPSRDQIIDLSKGCDLLIATPGRLKDFIERDQVLSFRRVKYTIIDEADEMVTPDWEDDMKLIMGGADANNDDDHVYMMFSATFPKEARAVAKQYMADDYVRIRVGRAGSTHQNITQRIVQVDEYIKREALWDLLLSVPAARTLIFVNSKKGVDFLDDFLYNRTLPTTSIHSDRNQREREDAIRAFKLGRSPILITTGVAARGLDIRNVMHVINYELPSSEHGGIHEYIHRIGRTARIGNVGLATAFYSERNEDIAEALTKTLLETKQEIPDFLERYRPEGYRPEEGETLDFDDDTDDEGEVAAGDDGWGGGAKLPKAEESAGDWGAEASTSAGGWGAEASTSAGWD